MRRSRGIRKWCGRSFGIIRIWRCETTRGELRYSRWALGVTDDEDGARVECLRLLVREGADVNARDRRREYCRSTGFTSKDIEEELLKLGADVNAENKDGETPIFTNVSELSIPIFLDHGADLTIRNNKGQMVIEAAKEKGPAREKALCEAIEKMKKEKQ